MKKYLLFILILCCLIISGCSGVQSVIQTPIPEVEISETEFIDEVPDLTMQKTSEIGCEIIVNIEHLDNELKDPEQGIYTILSYYVENPKVYIEGNDAASEKINAAIAEINSPYIPNEQAVGTEMDYFTFLQSMAEDSYLLKRESGADLSMQSTFTRMVKLIRADDDVISIEFSNMSDVVEREESTEVYYFSTSSGDKITEEEADSILQPQIECSGSVNIYKMTDEPEAVAVPVNDLVNINDEGDSYLIFVDGKIENIKFSKVGYLDGVFLDVSDLWYCNAMTDCALQLKTVINPENPNLRFSYETASGISNLIITCDNDGNASFMLEDAWNAVG